VRTTVHPLDLQKILRQPMHQIRVRPRGDGCLKSFETSVRENVDRPSELAEIEEETS